MILFVKKIFFLIVFLFVGYIFQCQAQRKKVSFSLDEPINGNYYKNFDMDYPKTDFYVLDGINVKNKKQIPKHLEIIHTLKIKDSVELKKMKILFYYKSYTFYTSVASHFYEKMHESVREAIPESLRDMKMPLIINGQLVLPKDYSILEKIEYKSIRNIDFIPKNSPLLKNNNSIVYGAISVQIE